MINEICENQEKNYQESKNELLKLLHQLESKRIKNEIELLNLIELHKNLSKIRNRKASYIENEIATRILVGLSFSIRMDDEAIPEDYTETLEEEYKNNERIALKLSSKLLKYGKEIITSIDDKSKRCKNRFKLAVQLLNELQQFYEINGIKKLFRSKIQDNDADLQFFALHGLELYYSHENVEELSRNEEEELEGIIKNTKTRETASTCCQILINLGKIDEVGAIIRMDDWKDRNWNY